MRECLYCDSELPGGSADERVGAAGSRHAYDPVLGRLWEVCPRCLRWNPVPLQDRWEAIEAWEAEVRPRGTVLLRTEELALLRVGGGEVVRVGRPPLPEWGGWRYGVRLPPPAGRRPSLLARLLGRLPPPPLEGYDPYGLSGAPGGVGGRGGPSQWLASPFLDGAQALTLAFTAVPFARRCPSCGAAMPLNPWDFQRVSFRVSGGEPGMEAPCAGCGTLVLLGMREARPALRMGLAVLDSGSEAREVGEEAGARLDAVGGRDLLLRGLGELGAALGDLGRVERVTLAIALDQEAESDALEAEWREAEELARIVEGELTEVSGFMEFRERVLGGEG